VAARRVDPMRAVAEDDAGADCHQRCETADVSADVSRGR
jgi:hypothetical protein